MDTFPLGMRVVHSVEGDVGRVYMHGRVIDGLLMHYVDGCKVPLPGDELRKWSVLRDGNLQDAYETLRWQCQWEISRSDDNFVCVPDSQLMETLVVLGLAEKKFPCWYKVIVPTPSVATSSVSYWAE